MTFKPFQDAVASSQIDHLTFENQGERVSIYGSLQISQDQHGLKLALQLQQRINEIVKVLNEQTHLPEKIHYDTDEQIDNPFK